MLRFRRKLDQVWLTMSDSFRGTIA